LNSLLVRIAKTILILEIIYLILINTVLNLSLSQTLINRINPETLVVSWKHAWSPYPFRIYAQALLVHGQTDTLQWQVGTSTVSASISLPSLLWHSVRLSAVTVKDVAYSQRTLGETDNTYDPIGTSFPPSKERILEEAEETEETEPSLQQTRTPWSVSITNIHAHGSHAFRLDQIHGKLKGEYRSDLHFDGGEGGFSLENGNIDINFQSLTLNGDRQVIRDGSIKGTVSFLPFLTEKAEEHDILEFLNVDAEVHTETENLTFLNIYLTNFEGLAVDGRGLVEGRIHLQRGELLPGTDLNVSARKLSLDILDKHLKGDGRITIKAADNKDETHFLITFSTLEAFDTDQKVLLFLGNGVSVTGQANRSILPGKNKPFQGQKLRVTIPAVEIPDISVYQAYIPEQLALHLYGGQGRLQGFAEVTQTGITTDLRLSSKAADVGFKAYRFHSNLDVLLKVTSPAIASELDISGTYVHLQGAQLSNEMQHRSEPLDIDVDILKGKLKILLPGGMVEETGFRELYQRLKRKGLLTTLDSGDEGLQITASISDLMLLSILLNNSYGLAVTGAGKVSADVFLSQGWLAKGSRLAIHPQVLGVEVLDYTAVGEGEVSLLIENGGEKPDMLLNILLNNAGMRRKDEEKTFIEDVTISLEALARKVTIGNKVKDMSLHLQIPSAKVRDMSVYNQYLPVDSPLHFTGGKAHLSSDIRMTPESANGYVKMRTTGLSANVDQQAVEGELTVDILLIDGVPENMDFDISGSSLRLHNVKVTGDEVSHTEEDWSADLKFTKARSIWKKPVMVHLESALQMTNSKPIVAMIANQRGTKSWLKKALTIDDVAGKAIIDVSQNRILIPYAFAGSNKIDIGAKGVITEDERDGVFYVRYHGLHGVLKIHNGQRNLDVWNARKTFDAYDSDAVLLRILTPEVPTESKEVEEEWSN